MRVTHGKCQRLFPAVKTLLPAGAKWPKIILIGMATKMILIDWWSWNGVDCIAILLQLNLEDFLIIILKNLSTCFSSQNLIFFLHRLYAGSSNTVAPNNSQGFQVIQFMIIASPSFIFTTIFKDQFGSHHLTLMSAYCQNQHIFRINLVPTTQLWCYNQLIVIFTTIFRINLVLTIQLWWVGLGIQAHSLTTRPWDSPGANVDFF